MFEDDSDTGDVASHGSDAVLQDDGTVPQDSVPGDAPIERDTVAPDGGVDVKRKRKSREKKVSTLGHNLVSLLHYSLVNCQRVNY